MDPDKRGGWEPTTWTVDITTIRTLITTTGYSSTVLTFIPKQAI
ncbi:hypothetical protein HNR06_000991 [Nocardiopsis arvandica]|uniref:Uncharacterized protein n=1 Tax=Nocardiopsis sinuspersici TaxID=501010 RepID=A0A7Y9XAH6_9ACTN|nr:hypothetical protein [Nocardiopsis sinuspersici]